MCPVSVVIPTYNGDLFVEDAIKSIWAQTVLPSEIICVDDGSTDGTVCRLKHLSAISPVPIKVLSNTTNSGGPSTPMNLGVRHAKESIIATLDQDDLMLPSRLELQLAALEATRTVGVITGLWKDFTDVENHNTEWESDRILYLNANDFKVGKSGHKFNGNKLYHDLVTQGNFMIGASTLMFRKSVWCEWGGFREDLKCCWDYDWAFKAAIANNIAWVDEIVALKRNHPSNLTKNNLNHWGEILREKVKRNKEYCQQHGSLLSMQEIDILRDELLGYGYHESKSGSVRNFFFALSCAKGLGASTYCVATELIKLFPRRCSNL